MNQFKRFQEAIKLEKLEDFDKLLDEIQNQFQ